MFTVRAVCFDLMDTVLFDPYEEAVQAATGLEWTELRAARNPDAWIDFELARISEDQFKDRFFIDGRSLDIATFHRVRRARYRWTDGIRDLAAELEGVVGRYLASNYPVWIDELEARFRLGEYFDGVWASHHLGVRKPDTQFYHRLAERIGLVPGACLFVDDRERNCEGAARAGMRVHHFTDVTALRKRLVDEGVLSDDYTAGTQR